MEVWVIEAGERWRTDTAIYGDRAELVADLERDGHTWRGRTLYITLDTVRKMAGKD